MSVARVTPTLNSYGESVMEDKLGHSKYPFLGFITQRTQHELELADMQCPCVMLATLLSCHLRQLRDSYPSTIFENNCTSPHRLGDFGRIPMPHAFNRLTPN
jgi:hypothetical protein